MTIRFRIPALAAAVATAALVLTACSTTDTTPIQSGATKAGTKPSSTSRGSSGRSLTRRRESAGRRQTAFKMRLPP